MVIIQDFEGALSSQQSFEVLYSICERLIALGVTRENLYSSLENYMHVNNDIGDYEIVVTDIMDCLVGYAQGGWCL